MRASHFISIVSCPYPFSLAAHDSNFTSSVPTTICTCNIVLKQVISVKGLQSYKNFFQQMWKESQAMYYSHLMNLTKAHVSRVKSQVGMIVIKTSWVNYLIRLQNEIFIESRLLEAEQVLTSSEQLTSTFEKLIATHSYL